MHIHAGLMTQNELLDLTANVISLLPFVDSVTVVDGGSTDGTIPYMRNWAEIEPKIRLFIHPWKDNFPAQRNNYLARIGEIATPGDWVLAFDPDEFVGAPERLAETVRRAEEHGHGRVGLRCRSVSLKGHKRVWESEDQFWKNLLIKWTPGLHYGHDGQGPVHETLHGAGAEIRSGTVDWLPEMVYEHRKQQNVIWPRGVRNYFCGGGGPNLGATNPRWVEMRQIAAPLGLDTWAKMYAYLLAGNIAVELKEWIIKYHRETGWDGASEQREWYKTYFRMFHPEEEPPELRGTPID